MIVVKWICIDILPLCGVVSMPYPYFILINQFINFIFVFICLFLKGVQVYPVPPSLNSRRPCYRPVPPLMVVGGDGLLVSGE